MQNRKQILDKNNGRRYSFLSKSLISRYVTHFSLCHSFLVSFNVAILDIGSQVAGLASLKWLDWRVSSGWVQGSQVPGYKGNKKRYV